MTTSKLLEKIILTRLIAETERLHLISKEQFGFKTALSKATGISFNRKLWRLYTVDIEQAFYRRKVLVHRMYAAGINVNVVKNSKSFLETRRFWVKVKQEISEVKTMKATPGISITYSI